MEELELVFEVLEGGSDGVETPRLRRHRGAVLRSRQKIFGEHEPSLPVTAAGLRCRFQVAGVGLGQGLDGAEEVGAREGVDGVADLVVEVPDPLQHLLDLLHLPAHGEQEGDGVRVSFAPPIQEQQCLLWKVVTESKSLILTYAKDEVAPIVSVEPTTTLRGQ
ncbi:hypothetical protein BHE74_00049682 [Ensete ventricosum]|nr:hypothetical protein BHE74_00049682 [Ensete ventricosum]